MGLSIHKGCLSDPAYLSEMIQEVKDIAEGFNWDYYIYEREFPENTFSRIDYNQNIYGIRFTIPNCEPIWICFLSNGKMSNPFLLKFFGKGENSSEQEYLYMLSVKTQYSGIEWHKFIIHLFKYFDKKYLKGFEMIDERGYWENGDEEILEKNFKRYNDLMDSFSLAIESYPKMAGESFEAYFEKLIKQIKQNNTK